MNSLCIRFNDLRCYKFLETINRKTNLVIYYLLKQLDFLQD